MITNLVTRNVQIVESTFDKDHKYNFCFECINKRWKLHTQQKQTLSFE